MYFIISNSAWEPIGVCALVVTNANCGEGSKWPPADGAWVTEATHGWQCEERDTEYGTEGGDQFPWPRDRHGVSVSNSTQGDLEAVRRLGDYSLHSQVSSRGCDVIIRTLHWHKRVLRVGK